MPVAHAALFWRILFSNGGGLASAYQTSKAGRAFFVCDECKITFFHGSMVHVCSFQESNFMSSKEL